MSKGGHYTSINMVLLMQYFQLKAFKIDFFQMKKRASLLLAYRKQSSLL